MHYLLTEPFFIIKNYYVGILPNIALQFKYKQDSDCWSILGIFLFPSVPADSAIETLKPNFFFSGGLNKQTNMNAYCVNISIFVWLWQLSCAIFENTIFIFFYKIPLVEKHAVSIYDVFVYFNVFTSFMRENVQIIYVLFVFMTWMQLNFQLFSG